MKKDLEVFSDMSEHVYYNLPGFPLRVRKEWLHYFDRYTVACHWHPDLEFVLVLKGTIDYFINGQTLRINEDEALFVNSKRLHYGYSKKEIDCQYILVLVHPEMLGVETNVVKEYFESKFDSNAEDYILLTSNTDWQNEAMRFISLIYEEMTGDDRNPLRLISYVTTLCSFVGENIQHAEKEFPDKSALRTVWAMTGFIQENYNSQITLDDIAAAGSVCRSKCCRLFNEYVGQTPNSYLTKFRISKSCEMLKESNMSILEIALTCGFQSQSYFTHIFQKIIRFTPREYRHLN